MTNSESGLTTAGLTTGESRWLIQAMARVGLRHWLYGRAAGEAAWDHLLVELDHRRAGRLITPDIACLEACLEASLTAALPEDTSPPQEPTPNPTHFPEGAS